MKAVLEMFKKSILIAGCVYFSSFLNISCAENTNPEIQYDVKKPQERGALNKPDSRIIGVNKTSGPVNLKIKLDSGFLVEGEIYREANEAKDRKSAIYIRSYEPLNMSDDDFLELLEVLLEYEKEFLSTRISSIKFDMDAVDSIWQSVISAVTTEQKSNHNRVRQKRDQLYHIISPAINQVEVISRICGLLGKYEYECSTKSAGTSHLFKVEYRGQKWSDLSNLADAGLDRGVSTVNFLVQ